MYSSVKIEVNSRNSAAKFLRTVSFVILSSVFMSTFNPSSWAMEEERSGPEKLRFRSKKEILDNCQKVKMDQWNKEVQTLSEEFRLIVKAQVEKNFLETKRVLNSVALDNKLNTMIEKWEKSAFNLFNYYSCLQSGRNLRKLSGKSFPGILFDFVVELETIFDTLNEECSKQGFKKAHQESFPVFQNVLTGYMKHYKEIEKKELSDFGLLGFSKKHNEADYGNLTQKHLAYLWNSNGILLFTIFPHENIQERLHTTYVPYGTEDLDPLQERRVLFNYILDTPQIVENTGYYIDLEEGYVGIRYYTGRQGSLESLPFTLNKGVKIVPPDEIERLGLHKLGNINPALEKTRLILLDFLQGSESGFIEIPKSPAEQREAHYIHLLELKENQKTQPDDRDVLYALECTQNEFPEKTLEEAIRQAKKELKEAIVDEEEKKIRQEQDQRGQMVINDAYKTSSGKKSVTKGRGKGRKGQNIRPLREKEPEVKKSQEIDSTVLEVIRKKAKKRINLLKNKSIRDNQKSIKYDKYLKLVNVAVQGLREAGVPVEMALNKSSHGYLSFGEQKLPLCVPHGRRDTITSSSAKGTLDTLLDAYLNTLGGLKTHKPKSE